MSEGVIKLLQKRPELKSCSFCGFDEEFKVGREYSGKGTTFFYYIFCPHCLARSPMINPQDKNQWAVNVELAVSFHNERKSGKIILSGK